MASAVYLQWLTAFRWSKRLSEAQQGKACCTDCSNGCTVERFYPVVTNGDWNEFGQAPKKTKRPQESERFHSVGKTLTHGDWNEFGQAPKSMLFQRTGAFLSWQKTARFCWKKELRSIFGTVCGGRFVVNFVGFTRAQQNRETRNSHYQNSRRGQEKSIGFAGAYWLRQTL